MANAVFNRINRNNVSMIQASYLILAHHAANGSKKSDPTDGTKAISYILQSSGFFEGDSSD